MYTRRTAAVVGAPVKRNDDVATRTVTVSIAYKPTLAAGKTNYNLMGCYGQTGLDGQGVHPFGKEKDYASPASIDTKRLTVDSCLAGCQSLKPPTGGKDHFTYVGLKNGSECYCGLEIALGAAKLDTDDCTTPCSGDLRVSCGGEDSIAIYNYTPAFQKKPVIYNANVLPPSTESKDQPVANSQSPGQISSDIRASNSAAVAVVAGSLSGAIVIGIIAYLYYRSHKKRNNEQDAHVASMLSKHHDNTTYRKHPSDIQATNASVHDDIRLTVEGDLVPTTPVLERGSKRVIHGLSGKARHVEDRDSLYSHLMHDVRGPAQDNLQHAVSSEGSSSAVQWRTMDNGTTPASPRIASPPPSAGILGLGDRAWHRRRLSTPYAPPPSAPLPPNPPARGRAPMRPVRASVATFEVAEPAYSHSTTSCNSSSTERVKPVVPLKIWRPGVEGGLVLETGIRRVTGGRSLTDDQTQGPMAERQPTIPVLPTLARAGTMNFDSPVLPPLEPGERFNFDSRAWKSSSPTPEEKSTRVAQETKLEHSTSGSKPQVNDDGFSPASATSIGTSILDSPTIMDWAAR
ncbi:hypothetical protein JX265_008169 [Neoarthrinium moseri]|uniref:WSC domain-containing protein n=1 Tax=Neoarthrinium moseri TaxID=1658444 RepID=A0A9P9WIB7_9PEZI|nr:uncharacterized protein JN550_004866 [Neoarthrinium moseri]KAI1852026.1 hypothetical protein JX266_002879 [Neoarthrinium moseri]KAI1865122.1 hypothetical protein JX265_008169 [Neoarthrinium moseri]KAI1870720.1 hypothetical protein JN550_004866 [Neoarthrinium moseri]